MSRLIDAWQRFWFRLIPPHIYALLRILLGGVGLISLLGLHQITVFWFLDGFVPQHGLVKTFLLTHGLGAVAGIALYAVCIAAFACMTIGFRTEFTVPLSFAACLAETHWNYLPLSGAHPALQSMIFCLCWSDCGSVWSLDARRARSRSTPGKNDAVPGYPIAPLRLIRFQIALIYLVSGYRKMFNVSWRDGSAVHYVLNNNVYQRFPYDVPGAVDGLVTMTSYAVLFWELSFALLIWYGPTRRVALIVGVLFHLGMMLGIEIGPFHLLMIGSYAAFLDPDTVAQFAKRRRTAPVVQVLEVAHAPSPVE